LSYRVGELINEGFRKTFDIDPTYIRNAVKLVERKISAQDNERVALVQGPPGTGKTTVFHEIIRNWHEKLDKDEVMLYIAPTNKLVADMLIRIASVYYSLGKSKDDLKREVRVYGSRFKYGEFSKMRAPVDNEVRIILTTEYQRIHELARKRYHLMIDEASKSPIHKPLITLSDELIHMLSSSTEDYLLESLNVIGDPKQAIALGEEYKGRKDLLLLLNLMRSLLPEELREEVDEGVMDITDAAHEALKGKYYEFLEVTRRIPAPSESPISIGFYSGKLRAYRSACEVLKELENKWNPNYARQLRGESEEFSKVVDLIEEAITAGLPMIYVHVSGGKWRSYLFPDILFDERRARIGLLFAKTISMVLGENVTIVSPYVDQQLQMKLRIRYEYEGAIKPMEEGGRISFNTIHRMLGAEDSHIVAVLGKEYSSFSHGDRTIYFLEPELLNVQFSRHKSCLIIIGDIFLLRRMAEQMLEKYQQPSRESHGFFESYTKFEYEQLKRTAERILEMANVSSFKTLRRIPQKSIGDGCIFYRWD